MRHDLLAFAADLAKRGEPYALATVVRREPPSSAQTGDSAVITRDGALHGWLGGSCSQPTVLREAQRAIRDGTPRLIALSPDPTDVSRPGVTALPMTCHSGGRVDIYIQPILPARCLLVYGVSPTARAVVRFAKVLGYTVEAVDPEADVATFPEADRVTTEYDSVDLARRVNGLPTRPTAVVATLGVRDEEALLDALALEPSYLGLVASRRRFAEMQPVLEARGASAPALSRIRCPAGLDVGAVTPEEIALTILTEIVQDLRNEPEASRSTNAEAASPASVVETDPVCGMQVDPATAQHRADYGGRTYLFCCGGCKARFLAEPERYLAAAPSSGEHE